MKLNKKAVLNVLYFWVLLLSIFAYAIGTLFLMFNYHLAFSLFIILPFITQASIQAQKK